MADDLPMGSCPTSIPSSISPHSIALPSSTARSGSPIPSELRQRVHSIFDGHQPFMERKRSSIVMGQVN
jgi:hypothetical protein